jgi:hypothetical protein
VANFTKQAPEGEIDLSTVAIPGSARMHAFPLTMAWWAVCSALFYVVVGAKFARTRGACNALIDMALSVVSYGLVNTVISRYAMRTGLSVALFSRVLFCGTGPRLRR